MTTLTQPNGLAQVQKEAIYNLFASIVLADDRIRDEEVIAGTHGLSRVFSTLDLDVEFHESAVSAWLLENAMVVRTKMRGFAGRAWLGRQILLLNDIPNKQSFLEALWDVAVSDNELHKDEADIIDLALQLWRN